MDVANRKRQEATVAREKAAQKRRESEAKQTLANDKRRGNVTYIEKARRANNHADELKRERASVLERIRSCQSSIDSCSLDMNTSEIAVRQLNARITNQRGQIFRRRADAEKIKAEAERIRREGLHLREIGSSTRAAELLEDADAKMREAEARQREAEEEERRVADETQNLEQLCTQVLNHGRRRADEKAKKLGQEQRVAEMAENLARFKIEAGNCETAAREMADTASQLERDFQRISGEADMLLRQARAAEEEADRLEAACGQGGGGAEGVAGDGFGSGAGDGAWYA